jgi:hypothetical protein
MPALEVLQDAAFPNRFPLESHWQRHYAGPERPPQTRLHATIGPKRRILLNANLYHLIGSPEEVLLYYNAKTAKIAIEAVTPGQPGAFPVIERRGSFEIPAAAFCRTYDIIVRTTQKFINPKPTNQGRLFLDLKCTTPVTRRRKR